MEVSSTTWLGTKSAAVIFFLLSFYSGRVEQNYITSFIYIYILLVCLSVYLHCKKIVRSITLRPPRTITKRTRSNLHSIWFTVAGSFKDKGIFTLRKVYFTRMDSILRITYVLLYKNMFKGSVLEKWKGPIPPFIFREHSL